MKPLLIAQSMTDIDEKFILGSMPPPLAPAAKPPRSKHKAFMLIFGSIAAALSGVLTVGLIVALLTMWNLNPFAPPEDTTTTSEDTETDETAETETETEAETEPEAPTVFSEGLAFQQNSDGTYLVSGMGKCKDSDVVIPPTYKGSPVVGIAEGAFYENDTVTSVYIPGSVTHIGVKAFNRCPSLTSVFLAEGVTEIESMAFFKCTALTSVRIPDSIRFISSSVFQGCTALEFTVYDHASYLGNVRNPYVALISCPTKGFTSCEVQENTRVIAGSAFEGCANLISISMPDGIVSVGHNAFKSCDNLTYNTHGSALYLGNDANPFVVLTKATSTGISSCDIPEGTRVIMPYAFSECKKLTEVSIPDTVVFIGDRAFYHCEKLTSVVIPEDITEIRYATFYYCTMLQNVTLPVGIKIIDGKAFENCALRSITLPDGLTHIGDAAFMESHLESIILPDSVTSVGEHAFAKCYGLTSVKLSKNLSALSPYMFYFCTGLTSVSIPEGVTTIGMHAFDFCTYLNNITLPSSLRSIDNGVFLNCLALKIITIPEGVISLGQNDVSGRSVFENCDNLVTVYLPKSLTSIGYAPFGSCEELTSVYYAGSEEEWNAIDKGDMWDACFPLNATLYFNSKP